MFKKIEESPSRKQFFKVYYFLCTVIGGYCIVDREGPMFLFIVMLAVGVLSAVLHSLGTGTPDEYEIKSKEND